MIVVTCMMFSLPKTWMRALFVSLQTVGSKRPLKSTGAASYGRTFTNFDPS